MLRFGTRSRVDISAGIPLEITLTVHGLTASTADEMGKRLADIFWLACNIREPARLIGRCPPGIVDRVQDARFRKGMAVASGPDGDIFDFN